MSHDQSWEKLFSYIKKGDAVRAIALYRLLESTIDDVAYAAKLKADILWCISDKSVYRNYVEMVRVYEDNGRIQEAVSVMKMLITMVPEEQEYHLMYAKLQRMLNQDAVT